MTLFLGLHCGLWGSFAEHTFCKFYFFLTSDIFKEIFINEETIVECGEY